MTTIVVVKKAGQVAIAADTLVTFGHWSTLGWLERPNVIGLDTGCVWGGCLSAVRFGTTLAERELLQVRCEQAQKPEP